MEPFNTPKVFVNPTIPNPITHQGKNKWIILVVALIVIFAIPMVIFIRNHRGKTLPKTSITQQKQGKAVQITKNHPALFNADLEYNPKNNVITLLKTNKTNGDLPSFLPNPPPNSSSRFIYKVEVVSNKNELLQTGWFSTPKELIITKQGTFNFIVTTSLIPQASINLYLPNNQRIWTGTIK